jgi:hypothetical protein
MIDINTKKEKGKKHERIIKLILEKGRKLFTF